MDSISAAHSGHLGLPLGAAEIGAVLFGRIMNYNPEDPQVRFFGKPWWWVRIGGHVSGSSVTVSVGPVSVPSTLV